MLGAIIGDIAGSFREFTGTEKYSNLPLLPNYDELSRVVGKKVRYGITDDSLLTIATAKAILENPVLQEPFSWAQLADATVAFAQTYHMMGNTYRDPIGGFGGGFRMWLNDPEMRPYWSCGNGSAMRVSPVGWAYTTPMDVCDKAILSAMPTHSHPEGIKGASVTALAIYYARNGYGWAEIKDMLASEDGLTYDPIESFDHFDKICQETMRLVYNILDTTDNFHDAVFSAVTTPNGDADTLGAIVGSIAEPLYGIPDEYRLFALNMIPEGELKITTDTFIKKYCTNP